MSLERVGITLCVGMSIVTLVSAYEWLAFGGGPGHLVRKTAARLASVGCTISEKERLFCWVWCGWSPLLCVPVSVSA